MYPDAIHGSESTCAIAGRSRTALRSFNGILDSVRQGSEPTTTDAVNDNLSRFRIWAGSIGAYHTDSRSADYRVREAPEIAARIIELLDDLINLNAGIVAIVSGERVDAAVAAAHDEVEDSGGKDESQTELSELCLAVGDIISSLLRVSAFLRKAIGRDRYAKAAATKDDAFLEIFDLQHIVEKFPKVMHQPWLKDKLGRANVQRRQYLRYARKHHEKMAHEPVEFARLVIAPTRAGKQQQLLSSHPKTIASSKHTLTPTSASTLLVDLMPPVQSLEVEHLDDSLSQATSIVSSKFAQGNEGALDVIRLAELSKDGQPFECPYCWTIVQTRSQRSWRRHVLRDVRAWTCTFDSCTSGLFEDRDAWFQHELDYHRRSWSCESCPDAIFETAAAMKNHLLKVHEHLPLEALDAILSASSRPVTEILAPACPLCDDWETQLRSRAVELGLPQTITLVAPPSDFRRHLGHHLEQLALFTIPPSLESFLESGSNNDRGDAMRRDTDGLEQWRDAATVESLPTVGDDVDKSSFEDNSYLPSMELDSSDEYEDAEKMARQTWAGTERMLGSEDLDTLTGISDLAYVLRDKGKYEKAETTYRQTLAARKRVLGSYHPDTLKSMSDLALVLCSQGKFDEAEATYRHTLTARERVLGSNHRDTLASMSDLALVLYSQGKYEAAETMYRQVLAGRKRQLSSEHLDTLASTKNLAQVLYIQGKYEEAEAVYRQAIPAMNRVLGGENPDTISSTSNLAYILEDQGKYEEAEAIYRQLLARRKTVLGNEHPDTLTSMNNLARLMNSQGKYEEAEAMYQRTIAGRKTVLGSQHRDTLASMKSLASIYSRRGRWVEAEELQVRVLETNHKLLGPEHPNTLKSMDDLVWNYSRQGRWAEAEELQGQVTVTSQKVLGTDHSDTLSRVQYLAMMTFGEGRSKLTQQMIHDQSGTSRTP